ncbi:hypothetical protein GW17_00031991 [Ensete ventricosum]|nr:hypothetical protein GW17_00031991 [Ensete ventricosum]
MALPQQNRFINFLSLQPQPPLPPPAVVRLAQLQSHPPAVVSTGLRLSPEEGLLSTFSTSFLSSIFSEELAVHLNQQKGKIEQFLCTQRDQLRRALAQMRRRHYRSLIGAAAESPHRGYVRGRRRSGGYVADHQARGLSCPPLNRVQRGKLIWAYLSKLNL